MSRALCIKTRDECSEMIGAKGKHRLTNVNLFDVGNCKEKTFIELIMIL